MASTAYNPAANGLAEAFNKTIIKLLKKFVSSNKRDWDEKLGECLWAYRTTVSNPDRQYAFFPGIRMRSSHPVGNPDAVVMSRFND